MQAKNTQQIERYANRIYRALNHALQIRDYEEVKKYFAIGGYLLSKSKFNAYKVGMNNRNYEIIPDERLKIYCEGLASEHPDPLARFIADNLITYKSFNSDEILNAIERYFQIMKVFNLETERFKL